MLFVPSTSALTIPALFEHPFFLEKGSADQVALRKIDLGFCIISEFCYASFKWHLLFSAYSQNTPCQETVGNFKPCFLSLLKLFMYSLFTFYYSITSKNEIKIIGSAAGPGGLMPCFEYKNVFIGSTVPCLWIVHLSPLTIAVIISV